MRGCCAACWKADRRAGSFCEARKALARCNLQPRSFTRPGLFFLSSDSLGRPGVSQSGLQRFIAEVVIREL
jgi:hypothetical protein